MRTLVIAGIEEAMVNVRTLVSDPNWLLTLIVIGNTPLTMGGPEITPAAGSKLIPVGSALAEKLVG